MKNLLFTLCFISGFASIGVSQDNKVESVMIRVHEFGDYNENSVFKIGVIKPNNEHELKEFNSRKNPTVNRHVEIKKVLDYWYKKEFKIETVSSIYGLTTYYLIKKD